MIRNHLVNIEKVKKTNAHKQASRQTNRQNDRTTEIHPEIWTYDNRSLWKVINSCFHFFMEFQMTVIAFRRGRRHRRLLCHQECSSNTLTQINDSNFFSISFWYLIVLIWNSNKMRISNSDRIYFSFSMRYRFKVKFSQFDPYVFLFVESVCILKHHNG